LAAGSLPADEYPYLGAADTEEEGEAQKKGVSARTYVRRSLAQDAR